MANIGEQLRTAREQLGITPAAAANRLHMRAMFVEALEREDWHTVGPPVYVRGFIRNYARMLGLDAHRLVEAFNETEAPLEGDALAGALAIERPRKNLRYPWLLAAMSAIAVLLVVKVVWTIATPGAFGHNEAQPPQAAAMTNSSALAPTSPFGAALAAARPQTNGHGVILRLELTQSCWLSVTVDGKRVVYETLPAGTVKEFHGVREISLRAGNAGGVVASIDGQPLGTLGGNGQVQDRVFAVKTPPIGQNGLHE